MDFRVLQSDDKKLILGYEMDRLARLEPDENERQFKAWHASWRSESLDYYLPLGWSFGAFRGEVFVGYFLAQTQLFTRALTQTLWIEHIAGDDEAVIAELTDVAHKLSREKHFQGVLFMSDDHA